MTRLTGIVITGCLLSGMALLTVNSFGQAGNAVDPNADKVKDQNTAPQAPAADKVAGPEKDARPVAPRSFDPHKMRQAFMDNIRETLSVTEEEWKAMKPLIEKIMTLSRELGIQGRMSFVPGGRHGGPQSSGEISKALQALEETLDNSKSTPEDIKKGINAAREAKKKMEQELAKVKAELLEATTPRQQGRLMVMGIID
jgi:hypothetical protein